MKTLFEKNIDSCEFDSDPDNGQNNSSIHIMLALSNYSILPKSLAKLYKGLGCVGIHES